MQFNKFLSSVEQTGIDIGYGQQYKEVGENALTNLPELKEFFDQFSGAVFEKGLFKVHNIGSFYLWTDLTFDYFKKYKGNSYCFAFDWVGRQYQLL